MNLYVDTSALIKRYLAEAGTSEVLELLSRASLSGTSVITAQPVERDLEFFQRAFRQSF